MKLFFRNKYGIRSQLCHLFPLFLLRFSLVFFFLFFLFIIIIFCLVSFSVAAAPLGKPQLLSRDFHTVSLQWRPTRPSTYRVQIWDNSTLSWESAICRESAVPETCVIYSPWSTVLGLKPHTVYYFRIYVTDNVTSPSSEAIETKSPGRKDKNKYNQAFSIIYIVVFSISIEAVSG